MYKLAIIGDGYTAAELLRLLTYHKQLRAVKVLSVDFIGKRMDQIYPQLLGFSDLICEPSRIDDIKGACDAAFLALPHGFSVPIVKQLLEWNIKCVDLGADFRLEDTKIYEEYYQLEHEEPELLKKAVYGIPELYREQIKRTDLVANPGCYPTSAIIPLAPLLESGLIEDNIIIDSKSGVTGAGRELRPSSHFCEVNEGISPYGTGVHRHGPEIAQELSRAAGKKLDVTFTPHLLPINRGILSTIYARLKPGVTEKTARTCLEDKYGAEPFVNILAKGMMPNTKWVYGSNMVDIGVYADEDSGRLILGSVLDNLTKGASGQAIQNMNLLLGLEETAGLKIPGLHP
ncbi:MAG: N-acetyl-gamma-glutamyl-phosphate reductase [Syntrophomonadaceae bacterium]|jgi:N-acetyl-gamma-glutamyl-phosphate reductase|nr:N-acetyl-gamma-glutamyl-phosphate reductase [Syntrophomonadaceae bacterium]